MAEPNKRNASTATSSTSPASSATSGSRLGLTLAPSHTAGSGVSPVRVRRSSATSTVLLSASSSASASSSLTVTTVGSTVRPRHQHSEQRQQRQHRWEGKPSRRVNFSVKGQVNTSASKAGKSSRGGVINGSGVCAIRDSLSRASRGAGGGGDRLDAPLLNVVPVTNPAKIATAPVRTSGMYYP